ncbi:hypothetical protein GQ55_5G242600 [Panicum hallii var. hallii]|uniref:Secreted protein n=1 Tax=Panicum hallii var. hallii TaxID=1504633 RepID=A0A2T7DJS7_9POAL|nr:hypothetical protein GQ55_5G242600 [Panicum hallii var. hallii]
MNSFVLHGCGWSGGWRVFCLHLLLSVLHASGVAESQVTVRTKRYGPSSPRPVRRVVHADLLLLHETHDRFMDIK